MGWKILSGGGWDIGFRAILGCISPTCMQETSCGPTRTKSGTSRRGPGGTFGMALPVPFASQACNGGFSRCFPFYINIYIYIYIFIYLFIYLFTYLFIYLYLYFIQYIYIEGVYIGLGFWVYIYIYIYTYICFYVYMYICICIYSIYVYACI